jgi:hypothetical protein|tara:strand:- start:612 stop:959 length:348 start_codon:yes stop_codon:yes gene_type:complete
MDYRLVVGFLLFMIAQTVAWYQLNSQFVWDYWKDKALLASLVFSVPVSLMFWYGTRFVYDASDALWTCRFLAFSSGMIIFPILTWIHLHESPFSIKTMLCLGLACLIIAIQVFMK